MDINNVLSAGLQGMQRASQQVTEASAELANPQDSNARWQQADTDSVNGSETASETLNSVPANTATDSLVSLAQGDQVFEANTRSVETADEVLGTLIDTKV